MTKKLIIAVPPPKPVSQMTDAELDAFIDTVYNDAKDKMVADGTAESD